MGLIRKDVLFPTLAELERNDFFLGAKFHARPSHKVRNKPKTPKLFFLPFYSTYDKIE